MKKIKTTIIVSVLAFAFAAYFYNESKIAEARFNEEPSYIQAFFDGFTYGMTSRDGTIWGEYNHAAKLLEEHAAHRRKMKTCMWIGAIFLIISSSSAFSTCLKEKTDEPNVQKS